MLAPGGLESLCRALVARGWFVTAAEKCPDTVIIGFDFMRGRAPAWLKAFEIPDREANPEGVEHAIAEWMSRVRADLERGEVSATVRTMLAEHGADAVHGAMSHGQFV